MIINVYIGKRRQVSIPEAVIATNIIDITVIINVNIRTFH